MAEALKTTATDGAVPAHAIAAFSKRDGRTVMLAQVDGAATNELVILAEANAGKLDWKVAHGPFILADLERHAEACIVGDGKAMTDPAGHRALAMAVVALALVARAEEHDTITLPPGLYEIRAQREYHAGEARRVQD